MRRRRNAFCLAFIITLGFTTSSLCQSPSAKKATFFIKGEVKNPGEFFYEQGMTLKKAIVLANGLTFKVKSNLAFIHRKNTLNGKIEEIMFSFDKKSKKKEKDIAILPNDVIVIPKSRGLTSLIISDSQKK